MHPDRLPPDCRLSPEGDVVLRTPPRQLVAGLCCVVAALVVVAALELGPAATVAAAIAGGALLVAKQRLARLELGAEGILDDRGLVSRVVPWHAISDIHVLRRVGMDVVVVERPGASPMRLSQPVRGGISGGDPAFDAKLELIVRAWAYHRGTPAPLPAPDDVAQSTPPPGATD